MSDSESPTQAGLTAADYIALAAFRHGLRRYLAFVEAGARSAGLTAQQHQALLAIKARKGSGSLSIGELAAQLLIKHHSTVELVDRLAKAGLIGREADLADRRRVGVSLTPAGEAVLASLSSSNLRELRLVAPALSGLLGRLDDLEV